MPTILASSDEDDDMLSDNESVESSSDHDLDHHYHDFPPRPLSQNYFAPPFYGRPPTPLPPSPSLTSLLRPSRPTTPDASDDDNNNAALGPVPRAAPTVPTYEYYGFGLYLFSSLAFLMYILWAYLPRPFLHALGVTDYLNRWWALAMPSFLVMLLVYIYVALALYNTERLTVPMSSVETIVDGAGKVAVIDSQGRLKGGGGVVTDSRGERRREKGGRMRWREIWGVSTDAVMDVPLGGVCEVLYGEGREAEGDGYE